MVRIQRPTGILLLLASLLACVGLPAKADAALSQKAEAAAAELTLLRSLLQTVIQPAHQELDSAAAALAAQAEIFCQQPSPQSFARVQASWRTAMGAWAGVSPINFGPLDEENLAWRFQFWPDPINLVQRKFRSRLGGSVDAIDPESLAQASVAIQGLSALEYLLFDETIGNLQSYQAHDHRCGILTATTHNLKHNAARLHQAWQTDYPRRWLALQHLATKPDYFHFQVEKLFSGLVMALDMISSKKLGAPLGINEDGEHTGYLNPWQLESWRSGTSLKQITATLKTCQRLYAAENGLGWYLNRNADADADAPSSEPKTPGHNELHLQIKKHFDQVLELATAIEQPAFQLIQQKNIKTLENLQRQVTLLRDLLKHDYAQAAAIQFRFNAHDGD